MQYPTGTNFAVNQSKLSAAPFRGKFLFKDGIYSILNIKRNQNTIEYTFNFNGVEKITMQFSSCRDADRIIAFCRSEVYYEPLAKDEFEGG
ncbi:hypothetical protein EB118_03235 [bacterium]|nr:hypothetical protein [bacterium]